MMERLQKVLARAGWGSRRSCESLMTEGRVTVDGTVVRELGTRVDAERAAITCDGRPLRLPRSVYYALHKPRGTVCTSRDPQGRKTVLDLLPGMRERVYSVGRLDEDSEGLLLVTNDGALCNLLTHPRYGVEKTYHVVVRGWVEARALERVEKGVWLAEGRTAGARLRVKKRARDASVLEITLGEGMNREVRRVFARVGHPVLRLRRIRIGPLDLGPLPPGASRPLSGAEVEALRAAAGRGGAGGQRQVRQPFRNSNRATVQGAPAAPSSAARNAKAAHPDRPSIDGGAPSRPWRFGAPRRGARSAWRDRGAGGDAAPTRQGRPGPERAPSIQGPRRGRHPADRPGAPSRTKYD